MREGFLVFASKARSGLTPLRSGFGGRGWSINAPGCDRPSEHLPPCARTNCYPLVPVTRLNPLPEHPCPCRGWPSC